MKYKINFREDLKKVLFPLDKIKILLLIVSLFMIIGTIFIIIIGTQITFGYIGSEYPMLVLSWSVLFILSIIGILIVIAQVLCKHALSKFYENFKGEFEKRFSHGFRILVTGFIIGAIYNILGYMRGPIILSSGYESGTADYATVYYSLSSIWKVGDILISLYILYGFLILISATKYYKPIEISPTSRSEQKG